MNFDKYSEILLEEASSDSWSDYLIDEAIAWLEDFEPTDWNQMTAALSTEPDDWKIKCAQTLSGGDQAQGVRLLSMMLKSAEGELRNECVSSLWSLAEGGAMIELDKASLAKIRQLADSDDFFARTARELLSKLNEF